jgi:hypothetical protein
MNQVVEDRDDALELCERFVQFHQESGLSFSIGIHALAYVAVMYARQNPERFDLEWDSALADARRGIDLAKPSRRKYGKGI